MLEHDFEMHSAGDLQQRQLLFGRCTAPSPCLTAPDGVSHRGDESTFHEVVCQSIRWCSGRLFRQTSA